MKSPRYWLVIDEKGDAQGVSNQPPPAGPIRFGWEIVPVCIVRSRVLLFLMRHVFRMDV